MHINTHIIEHYSCIRGRNSYICDNMDEFWEHYTKWNKSEKDKSLFY